MRFYAKGVSVNNNVAALLILLQHLEDDTFRSRDLEDSSREIYTNGVF